MIIWALDRVKMQGFAVHGRDYLIWCAGFGHALGCMFWGPDGEDGAKSCAGVGVFACL